MFGSTVLDVATGLIFVFLAVSLAASAVTEALSSLVKLRQRTLLSGIQALLNDGTTGGLVSDLYNHALVNPLSNGEVENQGVWTTAPKPAHIDPSSFAVALLATLEKRSVAAARKKVEGASGGAAVGEPAAKSLDDILNEIGNRQLRQVLQELKARAGQDRDRFVAEIGRWFDDAMERVSGWYKRYTQVIGFVAALLVTILLNADALRIGTVLWQRPSLVAELRVPDSVSVTPGSPTATPARDAIKALDAAGLLGWTDAAPRSALSVLLGWFIVATASLFGAPFWFDLLQKVGQVAGVGRNRAP